MDLFRQHIKTPDNLLSKDGIAKYYGVLIPLELSDYYFQHLLQHIVWQHDEAFIYGKHMVTKRKVAWYGSQPFAYTYSKITKRALPWTDELQALRLLVEKEAGEEFNSCLLNLYHTGTEAMGWHSDDERELKTGAAIASLSFGAERKFVFRHKQTKEKQSVVLEHGSLLVMSGCIQEYWQHALPATKRVNAPRINLTFRYMN